MGGRVGRWAADLLTSWDDWMPPLPPDSNAPHIFVSRSDLNTCIHKCMPKQIWLWSAQIYYNINTGLPNGLSKFSSYFEYC